MHTSPPANVPAPADATHVGNWITDDDTGEALRHFTGSRHYTGARKHESVSIIGRQDTNGAVDSDRRHPRR